MLRSDKELFQHIFEEIIFLENETKNIDEARFLSDNKLKRAFARSIEIIGEAVKGLSNNLVIGNPQIPWRNIAGMRDKLIHSYFSVNYKLVWDVANNVIPEFRAQLQNIVNNNPDIFS
ncbi:DUF86 domain-containing protein [Marispirochaeta sp.]|jgi:uncharacterized protein with HEPN domain|uniref:HepT-like ribonuclease domain-containing protein n=1 Tax=Marispirochaeta sp. TaxID=2038653 RepID=UPI0029C6AD14|nr:DUF86 domain-containing protein [Marispirochaeta sp.]